MLTAAPIVTAVLNELSLGHMHTRSSHEELPQHQTTNTSRQKPTTTRTEPKTGKQTTETETGARAGEAREKRQDRERETRAGGAVGRQQHLEPRQHAQDAALALHDRVGNVGVELCLGSL